MNRWLESPRKGRVTYSSHERLEGVIGVNLALDLDVQVQDFDLFENLLLHFRGLESSNTVTPGCFAAATA